MVKTAYLLIHVEKGIDWSSRDSEIIEGVTLNKSCAEEWVSKLKENGFEKRIYKEVPRL